MSGIYLYFIFKIFLIFWSLNFSVLIAGENWIPVTEDFFCERHPSILVCLHSSGCMWQTSPNKIKPILSMSLSGCHVSGVDSNAQSLFPASNLNMDTCPWEFVAFRAYPNLLISTLSGKPWKMDTNFLPSLLPWRAGSRSSLQLFPSCSSLLD